MHGRVNARAVLTARLCDPLLAQAAGSLPVGAAVDHGPLARRRHRHAGGARPAAHGRRDSFVSFWVPRSIPGWRMVFVSFLARPAPAFDSRVRFPVAASSFCIFFHLRLVFPGRHGHGARADVRQPARGRPAVRAGLLSVGLARCLLFLSALPRPCRLLTVWLDSPFGCLKLFAVELLDAMGLGNSLPCPSVCWTCSGCLSCAHSGAVYRVHVAMSTRRGASSTTATSCPT